MNKRRLRELGCRPEEIEVADYLIREEGVDPDQITIALFNKVYRRLLAEGYLRAAEKEASRGYLPEANLVRAISEFLKSR
jgi:hypothetical protein